MSNSNSSSMFQLRIRVEDDYRYLVSVLLFDSGNRIISPVENSKSQYLYQIDKGLYTVRVEMNAEINDKVITINSDTEYIVGSQGGQSNSNIIYPPKQFSSALLKGQTYGSSHDYYTHNAVEQSKQNTFFFNSIEINQLNSSLFIFMRFPSVDKYKILISKWDKSFNQDFELVNELGEQIVKFDSSNGIVVNENDGWLAFNTMLPNGLYYLIYHGDEPRQIPIYVFKNWHTQFFMTLGEVPLFGTIRIFISANRLFNPESQTNKYIDILLDKLQNADYSVDEELIEIAASGKYESPMLGLICAYIYFKSPQTRSDDLFNLIARNMQQVILKDNDESPDLRALNILAAEHLARTDYNKTPVEGTPMLRIGFEAIKNASVKESSLISKNSVNDFISETLYCDSPFNTFKPIPFNKVSQLNSELNIRFSNHSMDVKVSIEPEAIKNIIHAKNRSEIVNGLKKLNPKVDEFSLNIKNSLNQRFIKVIKTSSELPESDPNWVRTSIADILNENSNVSINDIASQLNLSGNTITRILDDWKVEFTKKKP